MAGFVATYTNSRGQERQLQVQAANLQDAKRDLRRRGIRPISLEPVQGGGGAATATAVKAPKTAQSSGSRRPQPGGGTARRSGTTLQKLLEAKPGIREKALFASKLSALVTAGVPIVRLSLIHI